MYNCLTVKDSPQLAVGSFYPKLAHSAILVCLLFFAANAAAFEVRLSGNMLSLSADEVPLQQILRYFSGRGTKVRIDPQLNPKITASFENRDIQDALESILRAVSYVLVWESIEAPNGSIPRLAEIQVFRPGRKELMKRLGKTDGLAIAQDPADGSLYVKDEILLGLKREMGLSEFKKFLEQFNATILDGNVAVGIYRIRLPDGLDVLSIIDRITRHPAVARAEPNYAYLLPSPYTAHDLIPPPAGSQESPATGGSPAIAILDTGLAQGSGIDEFVLASLDALDPSETMSDALGHGTQMALIASGAVKPHGQLSNQYQGRANIIPIRIFGDNGFTSNFDIMEGIDFALTNGARVMSLSWGSEKRSDFLERALSYAQSKGIIIVASAGNEPTGEPVYPAAYASVIGVGALGPDGRPWKNSNSGDFVTLYAPGLATLPVGYKGEPGSYAGTSISAALIANNIANYLAGHPDATTDEIVKALSNPH